MRAISNNIIIKEAKKLGFDLIGFSDCQILEKEMKHYQEWLSLKYQADMQYLERNLDKRLDVKQILESAVSVVSLGLNYQTDYKHSGNPSNGKISSYAWGTDYHLVIWEKLNALVQSLKNIDPNFEAETFVDTGPVLDKAWAVHGGLGWMGKHTTIINNDIGSFFFIATMITNVELTPSIPIQDFCGTCTACIDACPTNALVDEYILDSSKCISYLTIENKGDIEARFSGQFDNWLFGCDICQDVCPWNIKFSIFTDDSNFSPNQNNLELNLNEASNMTQEEFSSRFKYSPIKRTKLKGLKRNASFLQNS